MNHHTKRGAIHEFPSHVQSLSDLCTNTIRELEQIFNEIGESSENQGIVIAKLWTDVRGVFTTILHQQASIKDSLKKEINTLILTHSDHVRALESISTHEESYSSAFVAVDQGLALLQCRDSYMSKCRSLGELRNKRSRQVTEKKEEVLYLYDYTKTPTSERRISKESIEPGDCSLLTLASLNQEILALQEKYLKAQCLEIDSLGQEMEQLWKFLKVSEIEIRTQRAAFKALNRHSMPDVEAFLQKNRSLVQKLQAEKQRQMLEQVTETAALLKQLWVQYEELTGHNRECKISLDPTENNLLVVEGMVIDMEDKIKKFEEVGKVLSRREEILKDKQELEASQNDPDRLLSKKSNMAQQLLREEKIRNSIKKELPKLEQKLTTFAMEWEEMHGEEFLFNGKPLYELLSDSVYESKPRRLLSARSAWSATTATTTTPSKTRAVSPTRVAPRRRNSTEASAYR